MPKDAFPDLLTRAGTGVALALVGLGAIWFGSWLFLAVVAIAVALLNWEVARLVGLTDLAVLLAAVSGLSLLAVYLLPLPFAVLCLAVPAFAVFGVLLARHSAFHPLGGAALVLAIMLAGYVAVELRDGGGVVWMLWLILLVVATDICGYFAGRTIGGAKFWPSVSPKKTWAGVIAGWVGAGMVGAAFIAPTRMGEGLILVSIFMSFASQMGDIAESALKRRAGVKDSSNLLPGHGGVLDRLDGVIGAILILGLIAALTNFPRAPI
ncbi:MAG: phosphatidate cytidylyltransferase [Pseudomonadota bacterium]